MRAGTLTYRLFAVVLVGLIGVGVLGWPTGDVSARATGGGGGGSGHVTDDGDPTAVATDPGSPDDENSTPGSSEASEGPECWWEVYVADDTVTRVRGMDGNRRYSQTGRWLMRWCEGIGPVAVGGSTATPEGGEVVPGELAQRAVESVSIGAPVMGTSPASGRLVVQVPTWLWVDDGWWEPYEATATAGRVSATVTATPVRAVWTTGDGATVVCDGGVAWQPGLGEGASSCTHTYTRASAGYELGVTVELEVGWSSNVGESGTLAAISRSGSQVVQVGEIQAIGTR